MTISVHCSSFINILENTVYGRGQKVRSMVIGGMIGNHAKPFQ